MKFDFSAIQKAEFLSVCYAPNHAWFLVNNCKPGQGQILMNNNSNVHTAHTCAVPIMLVLSMSFLTDIRPKLSTFIIIIFKHFFVHYFYYFCVNKLVFKQRHLLL